MIENNLEISFLIFSYDLSLDNKSTLLFITVPPFPRNIIFNLWQPSNAWVSLSLTFFWHDLNILYFENENRCFLQRTFPTYKNNSQCLKLLLLGIVLHTVDPLSTFLGEANLCHYIYHLDQIWITSIYKMRQLICKTACLDSQMEKSYKYVPLNS